MSIDTIYINIKAILIIGMSYIFYLKIADQKGTIFKQIAMGIIYTATFSFCIIKLSLYTIEPYKTFIMIFVSSLLWWIVTKQNYIDIYLNNQTAFACSYLIYVMSTLVAVAICMSLKIQVIDHKVALITCIVEIIFTLIIMWLTKNVYFPEKKNLKAVGFFITFITIILYSIFQSDDWSIINRPGLRVFMSVSYIAIILFCFNAESIIALKSKKEKFDNTRLQNDLDKQHAENTFLNEIVKDKEEKMHDYKHLLPAYEDAIKTFMNSDKDSQSARQILEELHDTRLEQHREDSEGLIKYGLLPSTGLVLFDAVLMKLFDQMSKKDIKFELDIGEELSGIKEVIKQVQLEILTANLLQNAINATEHSSYKSIFVCLHYFQDAYELRVDDSGIPFEVDVLVKLGTQRITTHTDTGGSGIGWMSIFKIICSCKASLTITEMAATSYNYTKSITVRFDGKGQKTIRSYRADYISKNCNEEYWIIENLADLNA